MIDPHHVFVADAKPVLNVPAQRSVYVFGAASALGEAMLNQLLASPSYQRVYVSTTAALPGSVAHLDSILATEVLALQDSAQHVDCVLIINEPGEVRARHSVYAALTREQVPTLLNQLSKATHDTRVRYFVAAPDVSVAQASVYLASYAAHAACMAYGTAEGRASNTPKSAYQFKPQAQSLLDRLGVWVLNVLSNAAHGMLNPQTAAPLTAVKTAQRLVQRFEALPAAATGSVTVLQASDLTV